MLEMHDFIDPLNAVRDSNDYHSHCIDKEREALRLLV